MGERGPAKKPTALILLTDNAGCHKKSDLENEPAPPVNIPDVPDNLDGRALEEWHRITVQLERQNLVTELDAQLLITYCMAIQVRDSMWKIIQESEIWICADCGARKYTDGRCPSCQKDTESVSHLQGDAAYFYGRNSQTSVEYKAMNTAADQVVKIAARFGMSPSDRSRMRVPEKKKPSKLMKQMHGEE